MTSRCDDIAEALSAYADGQESPEETPVVRAHLESCEACRALLASWESLRVPATEALGGLPERVMGRLQGARPRGGRLGKALLAAALVTMAATGSVLAGRSGPPGDDLAGPAHNDGGAGATPRAGASDRPSARPSPGRTASPSPTATPTRSPAAQPATARGSDGELVLVLRVETQVARPGQRVRTGFVLRNVSDREVTFGGAAESPFDLVIRDRAGEVYRRSSGWSGERTTRTIRPGEQVTERFEFAAPAAGTYLIHAECACVRRTPTSSPTPTATATATVRPVGTRTATAEPTVRPARGTLSTNEIRFAVRPD